MSVDNPEARVEPGWSYEKAEESALRLEGLLSRHGMKVRSGSMLETHMLEVMRIVDHKKKGNRAAIETDFRTIYRTLIGVHELANLILAVEQSKSFDQLIPHFRLLNEGMALQNVPSEGADQATDKLFELFAACLAMRCGEDVVLDDPYQSTGQNPDVLGTFADRRWGIACKVLGGLHPEGFVQHLEKGLGQIENSPAEIGVVLFNLKNVLPHDTIWPLAPVAGQSSAEQGDLAPVAWPDPQEPWRRVAGVLDTIRATLISYLPEGHLEDLFRSRKSLPGFLLWAHSASAVLIDGRPTAASVRVLNFCNVASVTPEEMGVLSCLNKAAFGIA